MSSNVNGRERTEADLPHGDPVAGNLISAIHDGDLETLLRMLVERRELATARMIGRRGLEGGWRTPLHAATDWPGYFPAAPAAAALLLEAGADPLDNAIGYGCWHVAASSSSGAHESMLSGMLRRSVDHASSPVCPEGHSVSARKAKSGDHPPASCELIPKPVSRHRSGPQTYLTSASRSSLSAPSVHSTGVNPRFS